MALDKGSKARGSYMIIWGSDLDVDDATTLASVLRMDIGGGIVDWAYTFTEHEVVSDVTQLDNEDIIHGCGYGSADAFVFRFDSNNGDVKWIKELGSASDSEKCRGITMWYDTDTASSRRREDLIVILIQSDGGSDFGGQTSTTMDAFLLVMDLSGDVTQGK
jgi:hypothetical protein